MINIYELAEQAAEHAVLNPSDEILQSESGDSKVEIPKEFIDKFAELIVKECAGIYSKIDNGNLHTGTDDYLEALHKTFFGVK